MLKELDVLEPKGIREKLDRKLVRTIIGTKRKLGWGINWRNELADELQNRFGRNSKREECLLPVPMQYGLLIWSTCRVFQEAKRFQVYFNDY